MAAGSHSVQFYEDQSALLDKLGEIVGSALGSGGACIVIGRREHNRKLIRLLRSWGIDLDTTLESGRLNLHDAEECLGRFMVEGWPNREQFFRLIGPELERAQRASLRETKNVAAFGEMVAILWERGQFEAAIQLEHLWNELIEDRAVDLLCAYPLACFTHESQFELFGRICRAHTHVASAENDHPLEDEADRKLMVTALEHRAAIVRTAVEERERAIAQRNHAEDKLWRSEEFTRRIVEGGVDCVKVLDLDGRIEYMSPNGLAALEIADSKVILGRNWIEFWKDEDRERARGAIAAARSGGIGCFQGDCTCTNGSRRYWDVRITPTHGRDGEVERLIAVSRDLTELRQAQQIAFQAEKLAAAGRMAATIAHEINNPLEAVTNFIYLARTTPDMPEEAARHLEIADRELRRVAQIAQKTLGFYRDTSKNKWVDVTELINDVMLIYDRKLRYKHIEPRIDVDPRLRLFGKTGELKQVLSNLLANAIDASSEGSSILIRARSSLNWSGGMGDGIRISVADYGAGMSREVQKRIFVPFFTTKANVGTGIGLWVTRSLIEQQGGYLRFRSRQGRHSGTVMSFFMPAAGEHQRANPLAAAAD